MAGRKRSLVIVALVAAVAVLWAADRSVLRTKRGIQAREPEAVPVAVDAWRATAVPVRPEDAALLPRAAILLRRYRRPNEPEAHTVELAAVSARDLSAFHNPDSCYRAAGWAIVAKAPYRIAVGPGRPPVVAERLVVEKGGYRLQVLYWYATRAKPGGARSSAHASRAGVFLSALRLGGVEPARFFRVTTLAADGEAEATQRCARFASALVRALQREGRGSAQSGRNAAARGGVRRSIE